MMQVITPPGIVNPMTTAGDLIAGGVQGAPQRLALGAPGTFLGNVGGVIGWAAAGVTWPLANAGDEGFQPNGIASNALNLHNNAAAVNGVQITGTATGVAPTIAAVGGDTNIALTVASKGTGGLRLSAGGDVTIQPDGVAFSALTVQNVASAVNGVTIQSASTNSGPSITATGTGTSGALTLSARGSGPLILSDGSANISIRPSDTSGPAISGAGATLTLGGAILGNTGRVLYLSATAATVNGILLTSQVTGSPPSVGVSGSDTNISLNLVTKGTGTLQINGVAGSAGQVLTSAGASAAPSWAAPAQDLSVLAQLAMEVSP